MKPYSLEAEADCCCCNWQSARHLTPEEEQRVTEASRELDAAFEKCCEQQHNENGLKLAYEELWHATMQLHLVSAPGWFVSGAASLLSGLKARRDLEIHHAKRLYDELQKRRPEFIEASKGDKLFSIFLDDALSAALEHLSEWRENAHGIMLYADNDSEAELVEKISIYIVGAAFYVTSLGHPLKNRPETPLRDYMAEYVKAGGAPPEEMQTQAALLAFKDELRRKKQHINKLAKEAKQRRLKARQGRQRVTQ